MTTPKNSILMITVDNFLSNLSDYNWDVYPAFPNNMKSMSDGKTLLIISYISDEYESNVLTTEIRYPSYVFTIYHSKYALAVKAAEDMIDILYMYVPSMLEMDTQYCQQIIVKDKDLGLFDSKVGLFYSQIYVAFKLIGNFEPYIII
jgi:hypothetical protein